MEVKPESLLKILTVLTQKSGQHLDRRGLQNTAEMIDGLNSGYLYRNIFKGVQIALKEKRGSINLQDVQLDRIAKHLGFDNMPSLINQIDPPIDPLLLSCEGRYYSYIRRNSEDAFVLRSPVRIELYNGQITFFLQGPMRDYKGAIQLANGCLFILMEHDDGKQFHHIYQVGQHKAPKVLQGIFSGVSTVFAPIGGRAVLIRATDDYTAWENKEIDMEAMRKSKDLTERRLAEYFDGYGENNLNIKRVSTFRVDDLGKCK